MKRFSLLILPALSVLLMGAGCAASTDTAVTTTPSGSAETTATDTAPKPMVGYAEVKGNLLNTNNTYSEYRFTNTSGNCVEKGLPAVFSYIEDKELGYFVVQSGEYKNAASATPSMVRFTDLKIDGKDATCLAGVTSGTNGAEISCLDAADATGKTILCSGKADVTVQPR
jgi:hypothetical protein